VTGSLHALSFPRARPTTLLLFDTIRRSAQSSSSGLPQRKRTYFPNRTWGRGSADRARTCSRTHDSGRFHLEASPLLSMNSYRGRHLKVSSWAANSRRHLVPRRSAAIYRRGTLLRLSEVAFCHNVPAHSTKGRPSLGRRPGFPVRGPPRVPWTFWWFPPAGICRLPSAVPPMGVSFVATFGPWIFRFANVARRSACSHSFASISRRLCQRPGSCRIRSSKLLQVSNR
jgi:hypothetical protein